MSPDVIGWAVWSVSSSLNITIGLLLMDIIVMRFDCTYCTLVRSNGTMVQRSNDQDKRVSE